MDNFPKNFSIAEEAVRYMTSRFPRATANERQRMVDDWVGKTATACGIVADFTARIKAPTGMRILDAGSGAGGLSIAFAKAGAQVVGVDIEEELSAISRKNAQAQGVSAQFLSYDGMRLPFPDRSFDAAISVSVLEHTDSPDAYLGQIFRTLKVGGYLYLAFPNRLWPRETHTKLWFLSYLPARLRSKVVSLFKRNPIEDNNLHFYTLHNLNTMIARINHASSLGRFVFVEEKGRSTNPCKVALKRGLRFFGVSYRMFLPHVMFVLQKEKQYGRR